MGKVSELSECNHGMTPVEFNVLIAPEEMETTTASGIIIPDLAKEKQDSASMVGRLVAVSPLAFNYDVWPEGSRKPIVGDKVVFAKYAGVLIKGVDGKEYRACKDKEVITVFDLA